MSSSTDKSKIQCPDMLLLLFCKVRSFTTDNINMINDLQLGYYLTLFKGISYN